LKYPYQISKVVNTHLIRADRGLYLRLGGAARLSDKFQMVLHF